MTSFLGTGCARGTQPPAGRQADGDVDDDLPLRGGAVDGGGHTPCDEGAAV